MFRKLRKFLRRLRHGDGIKTAGAARAQFTTLVEAFETAVDQIRDAMTANREENEAAYLAYLAIKTENEQENAALEVELTRSAKAATNIRQLIA